MRKETEDIFKQKKKQVYRRRKNCKVWNEKFIGWDWQQIELQKKRLGDLNI